jgi:hypothetical protein
MFREIHIHVEEPSMEAYLGALLPRLLAPQMAVRVINHTNKQKLLREVPKRLSGYAKTPPAWRPLTLVLVDRDQDDCRVLKAQLEAATHNAGLVSKSTAQGAQFDVVNRIVIEELEAWHFGDAGALRAEFPGVQANLDQGASYRNPDAIAGGTHEALLRVLQRAGHFKGMASLPKVETARRMAKIVNVDGNSSASFGHFIAGLRSLTEQLNGAAPNG